MVNITITSKNSTLPSCIFHLPLEINEHRVNFNKRKKSYELQSSWCVIVADVSLCKTDSKEGFKNLNLASLTALSCYIFLWQHSLVLVGGCSGWWVANATTSVVICSFYVATSHTTIYSLLSCNWCCVFLSNWIFNKPMVNLLAENKSKL